MLIFTVMNQGLRDSEAEQLSFSNTLITLVSLYACCNLESKTRLRSEAQTVAFCSGHSACETSNICLSFEKESSLLTVHIIFWQNSYQFDNISYKDTLSIVTKHSHIFVYPKSQQTHLVYGHILNFQDRKTYILDFQVFQL